MIFEQISTHAFQKYSTLHIFLFSNYSYTTLTKFSMMATFFWPPPVYYTYILYIYTTHIYYTYIQNIYTIHIYKTCTLYIQYLLCIYTTHTYIYILYILSFVEITIRVVDFHLLKGVSAGCSTSCGFLVNLTKYATIDFITLDQDHSNSIAAYLQMNFELRVSQNLNEQRCTCKLKGLM